MSAAPLLTCGCTRVQVAAWLRFHGMETAADKAENTPALGGTQKETTTPPRQNNVGARLYPGAALLKMKEDEMAITLGLSKLIQRRRLTLRLKEIESIKIAPAPATAAPAGQPSSHDAAAGSGSGGDGGGRESLAVDTDAIEAQLGAEADCIGCCRWSAKKFSECLGSHVWASRAIIEARKKELESISLKLEMPKCSVVVVGSTGAGKSTLLNSLLGEVDVLPTNGMRACTAVLIELSYEER